jgi:protein-disulfide isomerase
MSKEGMSKRQMRREQRRRSEQRSRMAVIIGVVLVALAAAAFLILPNFTPVGEIKTVTSAARPKADGNAAGDPNAPVKIEEFSDFQCPFCDRFTKDTEGQIMDAYVATGKVYFLYRSFGSYIGTESGDAAQAAYCAGDQGKFWEMHDIIFANQTGENVGNFTPRRLIAFAEKLGLNMGDFRSCFNGGTYKSRVDQDFTDGRAANIQATPSFLLTYKVNGETKTEMIEGALAFSEFQSKIEAALAQADK